MSVLFVRERTFIFCPLLTIWFSTERPRRTTSSAAFRSKHVCAYLTTRWYTMDFQRPCNSFLQWAFFRRPGCRLCFRQFAKWLKEKPLAIGTFFAQSECDLVTPFFIGGQNQQINR